MKKRFNVLSPDGFTITRDKTYSSPATAMKAAKQWAKGYAFQGYYSSTRYGRIPLDMIVDYCKIIDSPPIRSNP